MREPDWLLAEECLTLHSELIARFGGLHGLRDGGLFDSALNRPRQAFAYGTPDVFDLAALYAEGIVKNHPFLDGNKRTGFVAAALFLESNGFVVQASEEEAVLETLALAAGDTRANDYAVWLRRSCVERRKSK